MQKSIFDNKIFKNKKISLNIKNNNLFWLFKGLVKKCLNKRKRQIHNKRNRL